MRHITLITLSAFIFITINIINCDIVNDGASTSGDSSNHQQGPPQLSEPEACEISIYAENAINLAIRELAEGARTSTVEDHLINVVLIDPSDNRGRCVNISIAQETNRSSYVNYITDTIIYGVCLTGTRETTELIPNYRERREYFVSTAMDNVLNRVLDIMLANSRQCFPDDQSGSAAFNVDHDLTSVSLDDIQDMVFQILSMIGLTESEITREELHLLLEYYGNWRGTRSRRSLSKSTEKCLYTEKLTKLRIKELVVFLVNTFIKYHKTDKSIPWLCDFMGLYYQYKRNSLNDDSNSDCKKMNFGDFIYSKVSQVREWNDCIGFSEPNGPNDWCKAWRRIVLNSDIGIARNFIKNKPKMFYQDLETVVRWLKSKVSEESPININNDEKLQSIVCFKDALTPSCPNICKSSQYMVVPAREKRSLILENDSFYEREWFKDLGNKLSCRCLSDYSNFSQRTTVIPPTTRSGNWFSRLFWHTRCEEGSSYRETPRCDEFRKK